MSCNCVISYEAFKRRNDTARVCVWLPCWCHGGGCPLRAEYLRQMGRR
jgi:hypothetical protein